MTSSYRTVLADQIPERTTQQLTATVTSHTGVTLTPNDLDSLTLTLYDVATGNIINGRDAQSILNTNGGTLDAAGKLTLTLGPEDTAITTASRSIEQHRMLIEWTYNGGSARGAHEIDHVVINLAQVP